MTETVYDAPEEIVVEADEPIRIVRLNRPGSDEVGAFLDRSSGGRRLSRRCGKGRAFLPPLGRRTP